MIVIRARLERHVGDGAGGTAEFRFKVVGGDIYGGNGFCGRNDQLQQAGALIVVDAFNLVEIAFARQAVGFSLQRAGRVEELGVLEDLRRYAGNQVEKRLEVAVGAQGHVHNAFRLNLGADVGTIGLQQGRRGGYENRFRHIARYKREIDPGGRVAGQINVFVGYLLEPFCHDCNGINAGREVREGEVSAFIRNRLVKSAGCCFSRRHFGIGDGCIRGIGHRSQKGRVNCLPQ
jgi:hypothetical protein